MSKNKNLLTNYDPKATLTREEEIALYKMARKGNERALQRLLESWNGMFVQIHKTLLSFSADHPTMDQEDMLQEMRMLAIDIVHKGKWDPNAGMRLNTFINGGVRLRIRDIVNKQDAVGTFSNAYQASHGRYGRKSREDSVYMDEKADTTGNGRMTYSEVIADNQNSRLSSEATVKMMEQVEAIMQTLNEDEQLVLTHLFGLNDELTLTVDEIDEQYAWPVGCAKRIKDNVFRKIRGRYRLDDDN